MATVTLISELKKLVDWWTEIEVIDKPYTCKRCEGRSAALQDIISRYERRYQLPKEG